LAPKSSVHFVSVRIGAENRWTFKRNSWREWRDKFSTYRVTYWSREGAQPISSRAPADIPKCWASVSVPRDVTSPLSGERAIIGSWCSVLWATS